MAATQEFQCRGRSGASGGRSKIGGPRCVIEYGVYYTLSFLIFFPVVLFGRLLPRAWRPFANDGERRSIWAETKGISNRVVPFIFMA